MDDNLYSTLSGTNPSRSRTGQKNLAGLTIGSVVAIAITAGVFCGYKAIKMRMAAREDNASAVSDMLNPQTDMERQLVTFTGQFLMNYYNYSYPLYLQAVKRAEDQMTPDLQAIYSQRALDRQFINLLDEKQVSTDGFRIIPESFQFAHNGKTHYVQVSGSMTYTTGINGAQGEWPITVLLEIIETDLGLKVNNVQRQR